MRICQAIALFFFLGLACSQAPTTRYYTLNPTCPEELGTGGQVVLYIQPFRAVSPYEQDRFIYRISPYEIKFDTYRRWVASPAQILEEAAVRFFRAQDLFARVVTVMPAAPHVRMSVLVEGFEEIAIGDKHAAQIKLWLELTDSSGRILLQRQFLRQQPIAQNSVQAILDALNQSATNLYQDLYQEMQTAIP